MPDGHYGYPESVEGDTPRSRSQLVKMYREAGYSGYNMGDGDLEEPDRDDYETDEEYQAAMEEWDEKNNSNAERMFDEYGNYDVFHNAYTMLCEPSMKPDHLLEIIFDYDSQECHENFMIDASKDEDVIYIMSIGNENQIAVNGNLYELGENNGDLLEILSNVIVKLYKEKNSNAGILYLDLLKFYPELDEILLTKLTAEEYDDLRRGGKGGSMLRRFGIIEKKDPNL
ncbi:MAG: hypothetical protein EBS19_07620 [Spirochaetia bacterium]|nr:hypothetical protein [Spirochaetia bacterium]